MTTDQRCVAVGRSVVAVLRSHGNEFGTPNPNNVSRRRNNVAQYRQTIRVRDQYGSVTPLRKVANQKRANRFHCIGNAVHQAGLFAGQTGRKR